MRETVDTPAAVGSQDYFSVRGGPESLGAEIFTQLDVVVDLAVVRDPVARLVHHRLGPRHEVDDRQPPMGETDAVGGPAPGPFPIGPAVADEMAHCRQPVVEGGDGKAVEVEDACDSAHGYARLRR